VSERAQASLYIIGLAVGTGFGVFLALSLAEDGTLSPHSATWKLLKFGGLVAMVGGCMFQFMSRRGRPKGGSV
jgi:hypothetical protein